MLLKKRRPCSKNNMAVIGHEKIVSFFDKVIAKKSLSQSYCFVGVDCVGKRTMARYLAAKLLEKSEKQLDTHPDFYYVCRQTDEKTGKLKKDIAVSQARDMKKHLGNKPWLGKYQVIIIDEAELLNEESGNALLKSFEEAGESRVFFLLTSDDGKLLPTIRSRCQVFYFSPVDTKTIEAGLVKLGYDSTLAAEAARMSWSRPGRAIVLAGNENLRNDFYQEAQRWQKMENTPYYKKIKETEGLFGDSESWQTNTRQAEKLFHVLETWTILWREKILDKIENNVGNKNSGLSLLEMRELVDNFKNAQTLLAQNVNPRLVIEQILLKI